METKRNPRSTVSVYSTILPAIAGTLIIFAVVSCGDREETAVDEEVTVEIMAPVEHLTANEAVEVLASDEGCVVLDIRTPAEYADGHIAGAVNVDFRADNFKEELGKLDPRTPYLVHCGSGGRSTSSLPVFEELGFMKIYHLAEGLGGWEADGNPIEK
jgi:phage shock protein E